MEFYTPITAIALPRFLLLSALDSDKTRVLRIQFYVLLTQIHILSHIHEFLIRYNWFMFITFVLLTLIKDPDNEK